MDKTTMMNIILQRNLFMIMRLEFKVTTIDIVSQNLKQVQHKNVQDEKLKQMTFLLMVSLFDFDLDQKLVGVK